MKWKGRYKNMNPSMYRDDFDNFFVVVEQANEPQKPEILEINDGKNGLHFIRWRQLLQTAETRNRNGRHWPKEWLLIMTQDPLTQEALRVGWPGEAGHPVPDVGKVTVERILTIDPNRICHKINSIEWVGNSIYGILETLDDCGGPGDRFMKNILQGMDPAMSARTLVPQKKNMDGTIDVVGPGRLVTFDRVFMPSHPDAYIDKSIPVKEIISKSKFETAMENFQGGFAHDMLKKSEKVKRITDSYQIAMESAIMGSSGFLSVRDEKSKSLIAIAPELKYRREYSNYMKEF